MLTGSTSFGHSLNSTFTLLPDLRSFILIFICCGTDIASFEKLSSGSIGVEAEVEGTFTFMASDDDDRAGTEGADASTKLTNIRTSSHAVLKALLFVLKIFSAILFSRGLPNFDKLDTDISALKSINKTLYQ